MCVDELCLKVTNFHPLRRKPWVMGVPIPEHAILLSFNQRPNIQWYYYFKTVTFLFIYFLYKNIRKELSARTTSEKGLHQVELRFIAKWGRVNRVTNYGLTDFSHNQ